MMLDFSSLNLQAVFVAALAGFFVGFMWHGPLFGKTWSKLMGITEAQMKAEQAKGFMPMCPKLIGAFAQQLVTAVVLSFLLQLLTVSTPVSAVLVATLVWIGFYATTASNSFLWEGKSVELYALNVAYNLVDLVVICLVLVSMA